MRRETALKRLKLLLVWFVFLIPVLKVQLTSLESRDAQHCRSVALGNSFAARTRGPNLAGETPSFRLCLLPTSSFSCILSHLALSCVYMEGKEHRKALV